MKLRKGFIVGMVSLLGVTALAGCKKKEEGVTLTKVSISGVQRTYEVGDTISWDALRVTATFSDASTETFTKFEYDVTSVVSSETQAVIYTSGLHEQTNVEEGVYAITVALPSDLSAKYSAGNIAVGNATPDSYALVECSDPSLKTDYAANIRGAGTDIEPERNDKEVAAANENKFVSDKTQYVVGTLNPFIYEPEVSFESLDDPTAELIDGSDIHFRKNHVVKVKSGNEYVAASSADYTVVNGNVKFNESAIGKTFSLTVSLADFDVVEGTSKKAESTFEGFTVQKGLNIYDAKQLGILNVSKLTTAELEAANYNEHRNDTDNMFWNGTDYYKPRLNEVWAQFLTSSGTFTSAELQAYADTPAIFLQNKLEIKSSDIPSEYLIKAGELTGDHIVGCLRDSVPIYAPIVGSTDVEINGNFWFVDASALPLCKNERSNNGPVEYIEGTPDQVIMPGHLSLFKFCGIDSDDTTFFNNQVLRSTGKGIMRNINSRGNTGTDLVSKDYEKMLTLTGLIFGKNDYCPAVFENCIIKEYQIGVFADNMIGQKFGGKPQTDYTFLKEIRMYDCANSGLFNYHNGGTHVSKSVFNRFGAAPLMNAGCVDENRTPNTKFTPDVIFNNEITGEEIYFSALGATEAVGTISAFGGMFEKIGNQFSYNVTDKNNKEVKVMNLVSIGINGADYLKAQSPDYWSNVLLNAGANNELKASVTSTSAQWGLFSNAKEVVRQALLEENYKKIEAAPEESWNAIQEAYRTEELKAKRQAAVGYIAYAQQKAAEEVTEEEIQWALSDATFNAWFEANYRETFETSFAAAFLEQQHFPFPHSKEEFQPYFEAGFEQKQGFPFPHSKEAFEPYFNYSFEQDYKTPPVFQTEVSSELFWTDTENLYNAESQPWTATLEGNYLHLLAPVGKTCLSLVFRIGKLPAQA